MRCAVAAALLLLAPAAWAQPARQVAPGAAAAAVDEDEAAGIAFHRVRRGDTLELLAAEYYGDRRHKIYIMIDNGLDHARPLKPGERLRIPVSNDVTVALADTLPGLAAQYLGDERRAKYLAEFNGLAPDGTVAVGMSITVPLRVTYRAARREALTEIAKSLFADSKRAQLLKDYNFLKRDALEKGETIVVPIYLRVHPSKRRPPDAASIALLARRTEATENARRQLPLAHRAWDKGDYAVVKTLLSELWSATRTHTSTPSWWSRSAPCWARRTSPSTSWTWRSPTFAPCSSARLDTRSARSSTRPRCATCGARPAGGWMIRRPRDSLRGRSARR